MSATNHTANYELSQYIGSDEPKYLTDYNGDMSKIDTAIKGVDTKAETANTGVATNASAISTLDTAVGSLQTQVATVASVANGNTGSINTINSLIGNGEPTTTDKTIIGAINEINAEIGGGVGGLETRVGALETSVGAIETEIGNTALPTTAQTLTGAIAEIAQGGSTGGADLNFVTSGTATVTSTAGTVNAGNTFVSALLNADSSIGKVYGGILINSLTTPAHAGADWDKVATISIAELPTIAEAYYINIGYSTCQHAGALYAMPPTRLKFNTDKTIDIEIYQGGSMSVDNFFVNLVPCIYILKDLGD